MAELAPGLYVHSWIPQGWVYTLNVRSFGLEGLAGTGRALAMCESDWERIPGAKREELLDEWVHRSAEQGIDDLKAWLECSALREERGS